MHDRMPYGRNQGQGQGHSREVDRESPTGLIFAIYEDRRRGGRRIHMLLDFARDDGCVALKRTAED